MVFSSLIFLFRFLPLTLLAFFLAPRSMRNGVLLAASLVFYGWGEPKYILIMLLSICIDYTASNGIERHRGSRMRMRAFLMLSVVGNLGLLMGFKYANFMIENFNILTGQAIAPLAVTLPLGISFYTFQTMSYSIDVYRGHTRSERNLVDFGAYVCLFPQLIAGPIVKYVDVQRELKNLRIDPSRIEEGIRQFVLGLACKVLLANNAGLLWQDVQDRGFLQISMPMAWFGILAFAFQIYFDFSGYSLMAIGLGKILGFEFPRNFDFPYASRSITEFWRRWHMTLSAWFREYVYIPLGGNRRGPARQLVNLVIVWLLTGFWHGASWNFILWGLWFAVFLVLEKAFLLESLKRHPFWSHAYTGLVVLFGWVIFAIPDLPSVGVYLSRMFSLTFSGDILYVLRNYGVTLLASVLFSLPVMRRVQTFLAEKKTVSVILLALVFLLCVAYLVDASFNPFLYFRF